MVYIKKTLNKGMLFAVIAIPILAVLLTTNHDGNALKTPFINEVIARAEDIPEWRFFTHFQFVFFNHRELLSSESNLYTTIIGIIFWACYVLWLKKTGAKKGSLEVAAGVFTFFFLAFHIVFPAYLERYFVPVIFSFLLSMTSSATNLKRQQRTFFIGCILLIASFNLHQITINKPKIVFDSAEYYTSTIIKEKINPEKKYLIVSPYPETITYYYEKKELEIKSVREIKEASNCDSLDCAFEYFNQKESLVLIPYNSLFDWGMGGSYDDSLRHWYEEIGLYELGNYIRQNQLCIFSKKEFPEKYTYAIIYQICKE
jgi:hypothetical protein